MPAGNQPRRDQGVGPAELHLGFDDDDDDGGSRVRRRRSSPPHATTAYVPTGGNRHPDDPAPGQPATPAPQAQAATGAAQGERGSPRQPALNDSIPGQVYVPAYPNTEGGRQDIAFELRSSAAGEVVAIAFSSLTKLAETLGHYQPWVAVSLDKFRTLVGALGVREVLVDPQIDSSPRRIDAQRMRQFMGRS
jgi:hypothetical protein